jgi:hypothetical protein
MMLRLGVSARQVQFEAQRSRIRMTSAAGGKVFAGRCRNPYHEPCPPARWEVLVGRLAEGGGLHCQVVPRLGTGSYVARAPVGTHPSNRKSP